MKTPNISITNWVSDMYPVDLPSNQSITISDLTKAFAVQDLPDFEGTIVEAADVLAQFKDKPEIVLSVLGSLWLADEPFSRENAATIIALMYGESRFKPAATSYASNSTATGLMQITNSTAKLVEEYAKTKDADKVENLKTALNPIVRIPYGLWGGGKWRDSVLANPLSQIPTNSMYWVVLLAEFDSLFEWTGSSWKMKPKINNGWFITRAWPRIHTNDFHEGRMACLTALHMQGSPWFVNGAKPGQKRFLERLSEDPAVMRVYIRERSLTTQILNQANSFVNYLKGFFQ